MRKRIILSASALGMATTALTACGDDTGSAAGDGALDVVAGFYPLAFAAEQVGGDHVEVADLAPEGVEPHDMEIEMEAMTEVVDSDLVVYLPDYIPALDDAVAEHAADKSLDVADNADVLAYEAEIVDEHEHDDDDDHGGDDDGHDHDHGDIDPHLWLDPTRYAAMGHDIADRLAELDPDNAEDYESNAADFESELTRLDEEYTSALSELDNRDMVVSHAAFGYLADRYDLHQIAISGLSPDQEPTSQRIAEISDFMRDNDIDTIFFESTASSDVADTIARETGATTDVLSPIEVTVDENDDYFSLMRDNLTALESALK
ncbi:metal ABC transporter substrate-binding protein [Haloglycomyces albus]|uniref:metal ABC transporter substrate-binding protein n=1 Tax=Haloglycomyces albus TaxID=526067 RepID=UPI00046CC8AF|nr:zinc ABC transporter substrate-binding protein [Haloglycomyces albus]